ncbi:MAG TPA: hypothetical protein VEH52_01740 [Gaiellaceae bacterium]|nr:hypothetical protein [Gaiellaceae bacterium]
MTSSQRAAPQRNVALLITLSLVALAAGTGAVVVALLLVVHTIG